ncbi:MULTISPECIES: translocation/assembly module TamB domain-containing protein [unclassified Acidovorax]|uniref:translocation/assembly module TamB domain-containing protein n=1 Tax=unclassified Acidovorax TaxID=2684926 RepID=UPI002882DEA3|nr:MULTISPECIES: translocation/assembly module TamB domain-containing protein [unclassified Acidovorax]
MATHQTPNPYAAAAAPKPQPRRRSGWRIAAWSLLGLLALVAALLGAAWWWAGGDSSLAVTLNRVARYLPAGQSLESREVTGSVRGGGRIGWLRWSSPGMTVEVNEAAIGWQLAPLLQRKVQLGEVHAARVLITPRPTDKPAGPTQPLQRLPLPVQVDLPFRVDELVWAPPAADPLTIRQLAGRYGYDGTQHQLVVDNVELAQGRYAARATLGAEAPMPLDMTLDGTVRTPAPGGGADLEATAHATVKGKLATEAARLQIAAQLKSTVAEAAPPAAAAPTTAAPKSTAPRNSARNAAKPAASQAKAKAPPAEPMQADVQAQIAPWAPQPLVQAQADLRALDLAALWPQAPVTRLSGNVRVEPTPATTAVAATPPATTSNGAPAAAGWNIAAQLQNALPGPWDKQRLPVSAVEARAAFDGTQWTVPEATVTVGSGSLQAEGAFTPATRALQGKVQLRNLRPEAVYSQFDATPLTGNASAQGDANGVVRFTADIRGAAARAARPSNTATGKAGTAPAPQLRIDRLATEGTWRGDRIDLARLQLDALQAQISASQVQIGLTDKSAKGQLQATVPGASAQLNGQMAPRAGAGTLDLRVADAQRLQRWMDTLPGGAGLLQGAVLEGNATLAARWSGGWQTLQRQLQTAGLLGGPAVAAGSANQTFSLQAQLNAPRLKADLPPRPGTNAGPQSLQLTDVKAELSGSVPELTVSWDGNLRQGENRATVRLRANGGNAGAVGQWRAQIAELRVVASTGTQPGPWTVQLAQPLSITARQAPTLLVETSAGQAMVSGPVPGEARLRWEPVRYEQTAQGNMRLRTQGELQGLPTTWADAFVAGDEPLLKRLGLAGNLVLNGDWNIDLGETLRASASVRRASGDLRVLAEGSMPTTTVVRSSGQGTGSGAPQAAEGPGTPAGIRQAEVRLDAEGDTVRARVMWESDRAGSLQADGNTRLARGADGGWLWPADAPLAATVKAQLPDVGVWSALAPPGWRVKGTLQADAALSGTRTAPRWSGTLGADQLAVRSLLDGVDLQDGRLRATLRGDRLEITEFRVNGGSGSNARIAGFSGNRTLAPRTGGTLTGTGNVSWAGVGSSGSGSGIAMDFNAEANALQVLVRADRQVSVSGNLQARLQGGQFTLRGKLTTDRATIILPEAGAPTLGSDVVVRSAAKDREAQQQAQKAATSAAKVETARAPDIAVTLNLGNDFALQGYGITTRLTGELDVRSGSSASAPPRVTGEVRTEQGRYRAWGQSLDVETGLVRFNGPYDNPALDILAIRPNISVRAGVQVTGSAKAPRVRLYSDPDLPDAEKLSWVVLGRSAAAGGAEAALLQQAALALLGGNGDGGSGNFARRVGLDEIGFKGPGSGEDASAAALTFGKRLSKDLYVTYERSLSGALGTLYIFYDLSQRLTLRGQTGAQSAVDLIYTLRYD